MESPKAAWPRRNDPTQARQRNVRNAASATTLGEQHLIDGRNTAKVLIVEDDFFLADELGQSLTEARGGWESPKFLGCCQDRNLTPTASRAAGLCLRGARDGVAVAEHLSKLGAHIIYVASEPDAIRLIDGLAEYRSNHPHVGERVLACRAITSSARLRSAFAMVD
jgi:hypothetical protein